MTRSPAALLLVLLLLPLAPHAAVAPPTMMANVYRFSEAAAVLEICFASEAFPRLPAERSSALRALAGRIGKLVEAIGRYYGDGTLHATFEATRDRIARESRLKLHVKNHYEYCGERLAAEMDRYVAENEVLLASYFSQSPARPTRKRPPEPGPPRR